MATYNVAGLGQKGKYHDANAYCDTIHYITNPTKARYVGYSGVTSIAAAPAEMEMIANTFGKNSGKRVRHSILSFCPEENITPTLADCYAQGILQHYAPEYQIVYAVHENTQNVHIHFVMNMISYVDGHRYAGKKKDYYGFIRHMRDITGLPIVSISKANSG